MNSTVKIYFDKEFKNNKNPHKYCILWASKFHKLINQIMRDDLIKTNPNNFKYSLIFIRKLIKYFYKYGINKKDMKYKYLYRGVSSDFEMVEQYQEYGFMSTTCDHAVSQRFAESNGNIIKFEVKHLSHHVPYVIIDETIADYLFESEYLFLPGTININKQNMATYVPNLEIIKYYQNTKQGGSNDEEEPELNIPEIALSNKYIIWYRAITNRPVEIINRMKIPSKYKDVVLFFRTV